MQTTGNAKLEQAWLDDARAVISAEAQAITGLLKILDGGFIRSMRAILACNGHVVVTGLGKSGIIGQKISATLASTGTPSLFIHAAEAVHGDLGRIAKNDVVLALSNSGESEELLRLVRPLKDLGATLIALTGNESSTLAAQADIVLSTGAIAEACPMGLVPTASTTALLALGDALTVALFNSRGFGREDYARFHPGGQLGRKLLKVREVMRQGAENPVAKQSDKLRDVLYIMSNTLGRPGAASIVDEKGLLCGFFTDGDLRRLLERPDFSMDSPVAQVMHKNPKSIGLDQLVAQASHLLREYKIDQLPVVDAQGIPVGLLDIQDLLSTRTI